MQEEIPFGVWLRKQRRTLDLSRKAFANQIGCAQITLRRIEAGTLKPSEELANVLLEKLGIFGPERPQWVRYARGLSSFPQTPIQEFTSSRPISNLPVRLTSFIGRENETDEIINLIAKYRLVTLIGTGGIGKTRLSIQVGEKLLESYSHGVWFIPLDSLSNPALVLPTVAAIFDIKEGAEGSTLEVLMSVLHEKSALLIFDNCEHLLDACAHLSTILLANCSNLKILATSREALGVEGEVTYTTPSLAIPEKTNPKSIKQLTGYESVVLFSERAALTMPSFHLTDDNTAVVDICRILDGIPLAIELAAARVDVLQVDEIREQLSQCFRLLINYNRVVDRKHQTMRASMDWSWGLLNEEEQTFLQQLSVFAGGWTFKSAQAVCSGDALNLMSKVVKKSLILVDQKAGGDTRYRFHEIVRQYAREKLIESGEEEIRARHLKYFLQFTEQAEHALRSPEQAKWFSWLVDERDNIRAALSWANEGDHAEAGLYMASELDGFWDSFDIREGANWLHAFLEKPDSRVYPGARAKALCTQGWYLEWLQLSDQARSAAQEGLELFRACGDKEGEVDGLLLLGFLSDVPENVEFNRQALALAQSIDDTLRQADAYNNLGWTEGRDFKIRRGYWEKAIALYRKAGDLRYLAGLSGSLGHFLALNGDIETAQKYLDESSLLVQQLDSKSFVAKIAKDGYAQIALMRGEYEQARVLLQGVADHAKERGNRISSLWTSVRLAYLDVRDGKIREARQALSEAAQSFQKNENLIGVVFSLEIMAGLYVARGKPEQAARLIGWADAARKRLDDSRPLFEQRDVEKIIAACLAKMGEVAFSDSYDEGQKMTLDEAVSYTMGI